MKNREMEMLLQNKNAVIYGGGVKLNCGRGG
jgi:hypothetical protein